MPIRTEKHEILKIFWPAMLENDFSEKTCQRFIDYIDSELLILTTQAGRFAITDRGDALRIVLVLKEKRHLPLSTVLQEIIKLNEIAPYDEESLARCRASAELAARMWLTVSIDTFSVSASSQSIPPPEKLAWIDDKVALNDLIDEHFSKSADKSETHQQIPPHLTIAELYFRYNYKIRWTDSLLDHLQINQQGEIKEITVYEHLFCLQNHLRYTEESALPPQIVEEAIDTLNLLFPISWGERKITRKFLRKEKRKFYKLDRCGRSRQLDLGHYHYWRRNIEQLMTIMAHPPRGWRQVIFDKERRNLERVATFWIGAVATILAIIALVLGILTTKLAYEANRLAERSNALAMDSVNLAREANRLATRSFELDRRQACAEPNATDSIADFCL